MSTSQPNDIRLRKRNRTKSADILKPQNNIPEKRNSDQHNSLQKYTKSSESEIPFGWDEKLEPVSRLKRTLSGKFRKESKIIQDQMCAVGTLPVDDTFHKLIRQQISPKQFEKQARKMLHIDQVDSKGQSCLHLCCSKGNIEMIKLLIRRGANINLRDLMGFTPLHCSIIEKRLDSCEILLSCKGIDLTITNSENSHPIHYLVRVPVTDENVVQYRSVLGSFIKGGVDVNIQSKHGEAPIHFAAMTGNVHPVAFLLEHGANCNLKTFIHGETPLHYATRAGNMKIVRMLMENGADPTIKALETGDTPIDVAEQYQATDILDCFQSIIEDILESKAYSNTIPTLVKKSGSLRLVENSQLSGQCWITVENHLLVCSTDQHRGEVKFKFSISKSEVRSSDDIVDEENEEALKTWAIILPEEGGEYMFATTEEDRASWIKFTTEALQLTFRLSEIHEKLKSLSNPRKKLRLEERNLASSHCNEGIRVLTAAIKCNSKEELLRLVKNEITASALCEIVNPEDEPFIKSLVKFFLHHGLLSSFIKASITYTIRKTTVGETLFREMSLATRMISIYLEMEEGKEYIKGPATELLNSISSLDFAMDSNPNLFNGERFTNPNVDKIIESAQTFLDKISTSASKWPPLFRELMAHTKNKVDTVFPNMTHAVVGGFVFLRFLCPAIVTPHKFGLVSKPPDNKSLRIYVLITKILQSVSNGVEFDGSKEDYMQRFNPFIRKNRLFVEYFFNGLTNTSDLDTPGWHHVPKPLSKEDLAATEVIIFDSIVQLKDKMHTYLSTSTLTTEIPPEPEQQTDD